MDTKRFFLYAIVIAALTLAGCGGNGGGTQTAMPDPEPPAPMECPEGQVGTPPNCAPPGPTPEQMALSDARDAASDAYMAAMMAVGGAKDYVAMQNAQKYAAMAKEANDAAQAATTSAMAEEYQMAAETARDQAQEAAMMRGLEITKLANTTINQSDIDNAILEGTEPDDPVSNAVRIGAALDVTAGAAVPDTAETPAVTTVTPNIAAVPNGSVSQGGAVSARATRGSTGGPVLTVAGTTNAVTRGETPTPLMMRGGWMGAELVGGAAGDTNSRTYANVYTDIQATKTISNYAAVTGTPTALPTDGTTSGVTADNIPGDGSDFTGTYNSNIADNVPPVSGLFDCPATGTACSISVNDDGELVAIQGYEFRAATGTTTMTDADYLAWGVWLTVPNAVPVAGTPNAATAGAFASGNDPFQVRAELTGKATYNGVASGLYAAGGYVENFDADVMLEANFGGTEGADSTPETQDANDMFLLGVVTGTVSNINAGGMAVDGSLMLGRAPVVTDTANGDSVNGFRGTTSGTLAGRAMAGNWGGQFYGPNEATANSMAARTEYPTTAAGTFGAASGGTGADQVRILGAFGSWKAD